MSQNYKDTLLLPKTDFPMKADLVKREPERLARWEAAGLYREIQAARHAAPLFVLHDGPPFANGDVHMGTALNKILKDFIVKSRSMAGFRAPFVPGWDCHGLPIEFKVVKEQRGLAPAEIRRRAEEFARKFIDIQRRQFKRLGVLGSWEDPYLTLDPAYEAEILRAFASFVEKGLVYQSKKPVYWSTGAQTALAEAEVEYAPRTDPAIYVRFPITAGPLAGQGSMVIWTTTPWTLPANVAIAVHPRAEYVLGEFSGGPEGSGPHRFVVARSLLAAFATETGFTFEQELAAMPGTALGGSSARHPFLARQSAVITADFVTMETGTGQVHIAPGHGKDDYLAGQQHGLPVLSPVDDFGKLTEDAGMPEWTGRYVFEANPMIVRHLRETGALVAEHDYSHDYPHCWRSKTPIIFRAVDQWFVSLDKAGHRALALSEITKIAQHQGWIPAWGEARIRGAVESRPDWCISRQRSWGVPIIAFYGPDKKAYIDATVIRAVADKIATRGTNFWYDATPAQILDGVILPADWPAAASLTCGRDTLDVWIDSGSTQAAVLKRGQGGTSWPADLYLEGSDQHRGWFQSSLWNSVIAFGAAPYKAVLTHGFIVDKNRQKISKSSVYQKPQTADAYIAQHGADVIRLWIASQDFRDDIPVDDEILKNVGEAYRLLRNTFRFQLSNLFDFDATIHAVPVDQMNTLDRWALHQTAVLIDECTKAFDAYEFHRVYQLCNQFCSVTLSSVYHDILKDRLYTLGAAHPLRRSSQTAIHHIFDALVRILAPFISFTADEAWSFAKTGQEYGDDSIHLQNWPVAGAGWQNPELAGEFEQLLKFRTRVTEALEPLRQAGTIGKSLDAALTVSGPGEDAIFGVLQKHRDFIPEFFIVSKVTLDPKPGATLEIHAGHARETGTVRCPRCWRWVPAMSVTSHGEVCPRCIEALNS